MTRTVEGFSSLDHACAVPVSDEQLWEMTARFVADGLAAGEQVVYFDDGTVEAVLDRLSDDRVDIGGPIDGHQLEIVPPEATRTALRSTTGQVREIVAGTIDGALQRGFSGVRMTGQLSYALERRGGVSLAEYDAAMAEAILGKPASVLCFYDRRRFPEHDIEELRAQHHTEVAVHAIYDDTMLRITSTGPGGARLAGEIDHSNRQRIRRLLDTTLDHALRSHSAPTDITLDLSSLRFLDVAGAVSLVHAAEEFPSTHRLVLTGVRPRVVRVLDRCGAPFAAQLEMHSRVDGPSA
ncbi:MEDS domain-containing protein [Pseudonocardia sp. GCM10023141]|uniref:MEDS domain-containing protein n=1 Tax=Pseudonocardia sp. GCM10023141 TaxID=3252653 RepID=UPI00361BE257